MNSSWILRSKPKPKAHLRFFCFPYAGAGASACASWADLMPPEVELCAVQLPGRETRLREKPFVRLPALVRAVRESLRPYLHKPFAFFGHSMGALVSFELTRELRRARLPGPVHLFASGHRAPHLPDPDPPIHQLPASAMVAELRRRFEPPPRSSTTNDDSEEKVDWSFQTFTAAPAHTGTIVAEGMDWSLVCLECPNDRKKALHGFRSSRQRVAA